MARGARAGVPVKATGVAVVVVAVGVAVFLTTGGRNPVTGGPGGSAGTVERPTAGTRSGPEGTGPGRALAVLREWDARRAAAYQQGDLDRLKELYVPGSAAGRADARVLRGYLDRRLRVRQMHTQVLGARVLVATGRSLRVRVADRLVGAVVGPLGRPGVRRRLPPGELRTRTVTLVRGSAGWQVRGVTATPRRPGS